MREFNSGATRDAEDGKYDFSGALSPEVLCAFTAYMHAHRYQADGSVRAAGNWKKGIPTDSYLRSFLRHSMDLWMLFEGHVVTRPEDGSVVTMDEALGGCLFNLQGLWHNHLKEHNG